MADHPIIFSAPMVRALLEGRKTQTRRLVTRRNTLFDGRAAGWPNYLHESAFLWSGAWVDPGPSPAGNPGPYLKLPVLGVACDPSDPQERTVHRLYPRIQPGDSLYVREAFVTGFDIDDETGRPVGDRKVWYRATDAGLSWYDPDTESTLDNPPWRPSIHMPRWASRLTLTVTDVRVQRLQEISDEDAFAEGAMRWGADGPNAGCHYAVRDDFARLWNSLHGPDAWDANPWVVALTFTVQRGNIDQIGGAA